jgi:hypothetical protein
MTARSVRDTALLDQAGAAARHARWPQRRWAVEGAEGLGRGVAQGLAGSGEQVVDVPAQLAARARLLNSGHARKTDALDGVPCGSLYLSIDAGACRPQAITRMIVPHARDASR